MEAPPLDGAGDMKYLQVSRSRPLCLERELPLLKVLLEGTGCVGPRLALFKPVCLPSASSAPSGHQSHQGGQMLGPASGPALTEPVLVSRDGAAADSSPLTNSTKEGHLSPASCGAFTMVDSPHLRSKCM